MHYESVQVCDYVVIIANLDSQSAAPLLTNPDEDLNLSRLGFRYGLYRILITNT